MNRTENVSIGRKGFVCDVDAYKLLRDYLARSEEALDGDPDQAEILTDLEMSMAGHLYAMSKELVVDKQTARTVIELMGEVEITDKKNKEENTAAKAGDAEGDIWTKIRGSLKSPLKKDRARAIVDGVCAGMAKSLDIDPLWIRLAFILLTLVTQGAFIIIYIVLMILMKEGEYAPKRKASEVVDDIKSKLKLEDRATLHEYEKVARSIVVGIAKFVWVVLKIIVCTVLVVVSIAWASMLFFMLANPSQVDVFGGNPGWLGFVGVFSVGLVLLIPLFELLLGLFGMVKTRSGLTVTLWSVWALALIACVASFANLIPKIKQYIVTEKPKNSFVYVQMAGDEIASLCISPMGTCSDSEQLLTYEPVCGRNMTIYDKDDRAVWLERGWTPHYESLEYPASEEKYCERIRQLSDTEDMMLARQVLNDRAYVSTSFSDTSNPNFPQGILTPTDKEYWDFEYLTR